ncbi:MAG TPA: hypothetical protein VEZ55_09270 [Chitinophagaceae bacterium]|nr:hypothetical protein [Chitinophagaceae bacterium]
MTRFLCVLLLLVFMCSCKNKEEQQNEQERFFPVLSFLKSQVAHVDTSMYRIIKVVRRVSGNDTSFVKREEFRKEAKDFLDLPDISSKKLKDDYKETQLYDQDLDQVILNYMPKEDDAEITRQEVVIKPDPGGDKVQSIFVNTVKNSAQERTQKIMLWEVDKRFRITTSIQKANMPESTETVEVIWNDFAAPQ